MKLGHICLSAHLRMFAPIAAITFAFATFAPSTALAKTERKLKYAYEQSFATAVRFLRVDENATIIDKDQEAGFIMFEFMDGGKPYRGSIEFIRVKDAPDVRAVWQIQNRPTYMETSMYDRYEAKLRAEYGLPK